MRFPSGRKEYLPIFGSEGRSSQVTRFPLLLIALSMAIGVYALMSIGRFVLAEQRYWSRERAVAAAGSRREGELLNWAIRRPSINIEHNGRLQKEIRQVLGGRGGSTRLAPSSVERRIGIGQPGAGGANKLRVWSVRNRLASID
jgi:hypothetical protein